jgi:hypothetical protein
MQMTSLHASSPTPSHLIVFFPRLAIIALTCRMK